MTSRYQILNKCTVELRWLELERTVKTNMLVDILFLSFLYIPHLLTDRDCSVMVSDVAWQLLPWFQL
jgi:hypothetical protein